MSGLTDSIDVQVEALIPEVQSRQTSFAASHDGKFYQGMRTPEPIPKDGEQRTLDKTLHPSDQAENWIDFGLTLPTQQKWAIDLVAYDGPDGKGYVLGAWVVEENKTKTRRWNFGPETGRNTAWIIVT